MKPVEVNDERFARRLEEYEEWRKEHPVRRRLVDALGRHHLLAEVPAKRAALVAAQGPLSGAFFLSVLRWRGSTLRAGVT